MELKEIKKPAEELNESGKQQLVYFLQSRTKPMSAPIRAIDEIQVQKHKASLVWPHCDSHFVVRFGKYLIKTCAGEVKQQRYSYKACHQTFNDLTNTPLQRIRRPHKSKRAVLLNKL
ncbi:hypothetical protein FB545_3842 [Peribacillus frigoritolerans]|nr:hypothetical protein FB545_3842 [Peribacillus frigoritolerans]